MTWKDVIGNERESRLLDAVVVMILERRFHRAGEHLDLDGDGPEGICPGKFREVVTAKLAEDWVEGNIAEAGFTLDDLATLSSRLARLTINQWQEMLANMLEPPPARSLQ